MTLRKKLKRFFSPTPSRKIDPALPAWPLNLPQGKYPKVQRSKFPPWQPKGEFFRQQLETQRKTRKWIPKLPKRRVSVYTKATGSRPLLRAIVKGLRAKERALQKTYGPKKKARKRY